ncbi:molybdate ABC transporter substrate-binding protein [Massilia sp. PWRC2]|uniref:molybdate ABC transporter substrate-binding protein n=1 Tax=Massilia sp. PWRC2 TaxID=2804626 RepID=UPI003CEDB1A3
MQKSSIPPSPTRRSWRPRAQAGLVLAIALGLCALGPARAEHLTLYAAAGVKAPVKDMARDFSAASGHTVKLVFDTAGAAEKQFLADPAATFLVTTRSRIEAAEQNGQLGAGVTTNLGDTVGGFAVAAGQPKPDISTPDKLRAVLLAAPSIAFSDPARGATIGAHFLQVIEALGIKEQVLAKAVLAADGVQTMHLVQQNKVALGVTQISEIIQADPSTLLGPFPVEFDLATTYSLWHKSDPSPAAEAFARLLASPQEQKKLLQHGLRASNP